MAFCRRFSMSNGSLHFVPVDAVDFQGYFGRKLPITILECLYQRFRMRFRERLRLRQANAPKVLCLETQIAAAHANAVGFNKELANRRDQQPAEHIEIPYIRLNEIEIMVRVSFPVIK